MLAADFRQRSWGRHGGLDTILEHPSRTDDDDGPRVLVWGTLDLGKPRARLMARALAEAGIPLHWQTAQVWQGVEDKSQLRGGLRKGLLALRYARAILGLMARYLRAPAHEVVLIGYMGQFDVLAFRPLARLFGKPVVWDAFLSLHDTMVHDRRTLREDGIAARALRRIERRAALAADIVVLDTPAHAARFAELLDLPRDRMMAVPVGAEPDAFPRLPAKPRTEAPPTILFYGQFIPLHGVATIVAAARLAQGRGWRWRLIGEGQEAAAIRRDLAHDPVAGLSWERWVAYGDLSGEIAAADVCLGIFGTSGKAASVVPNKVYQVLSSGRPLVTRDGPAMRALAPGPEHGLRLVPPGDPDALVAAIAALLAEGPPTFPDPAKDPMRTGFSPAALGTAWRATLDAAVRRHGMKRS